MQKVFKYLADSRQTSGETILEAQTFDYIKLSASEFTWNKMQFVFEPRRKKTRFMPMRQHRRISASH